MHPNSSGIERVHEKKKTTYTPPRRQKEKTAQSGEISGRIKKLTIVFGIMFTWFLYTPPKTNKRREKVEMAIQSKEHAKKRLPAKADRAVWEKVTKRRAGRRWDSVVEKVWKDLGGNQEEILPIDKVWEV